MRTPLFWRRAFAALIAGIACIATAGGFIASAAVPGFPENITVLPDRDFASVEGYEQRVVNPDLLGTPIARRSISAIPGPLTLAPRPIV